MLTSARGIWPRWAYAFSPIVSCHGAGCKCLVRTHCLFGEREIAYFESLPTLRLAAYSTQPDGTKDLHHQFPLVQDLNAPSSP